MSLTHQSQDPKHSNLEHQEPRRSRYCCHADIALEQTTDELLEAQADVRSYRMLVTVLLSTMAETNVRYRRQSERVSQLLEEQRRQAPRRAA